MGDLPSTIDGKRYREILGHYPTGVSVVTAIDENGQLIGMVVGSFTSVSLDPPLIGFLPDKRSSSWLLLERAGRFCINVLASDQSVLCRQIATPGKGKFAEVDYTITDHDLPVLNGVMMSIDCELRSVIDAGDHWFVLGDVLGLKALRDTSPMLFFRGHYGGFVQEAG